MQNQKMKLGLCRISGGVQLHISNPTPVVKPILEKLGYRLVPDIFNFYDIICTTPAELDAARNPIKQFFNPDGTGK